MNKWGTTALLFLSACSVQPKYNRPETAVPESYRFSTNKNEDYVNFAWWEQFDDPVLTQLIRTALKNNEDIHVATATVLQFYEQYQVVFSQFFPQISAQGIAAREGIAETPLPSLVTSLFNLFGNISYQFDFFGNIRSQTEAARFSYLAQVDARNNVILTLVTSMAAAYVQLLAYDNQLFIAKETYDAYVQAWKQAKLRYEGGLTSAMDLKQAEAQVLDAETLIKTHEQLISIQEDLICVLLGEAPAGVERGKLLQNLKIPPSVPLGLPADLLNHRPDVMQQEKLLIAASAQIGVARANFLPAFTFTGLDGQQAYTLHNLFKNVSNYFDWQLSFLQPLYTGGSLTGQLRQAEAVFVENYYTYKQIVLTALQEVSDSLITYQKQSEILEVLKQETVSLQEYLRLAKLRYLNGQNDYLTVTNAEQSLFQTQLNLESARSAMWTALIQLYAALGQGWDVEADYCEKCDDPSPLRNAIF